MNMGGPSDQSGGTASDIVDAGSAPTSRVNGQIKVLIFGVPSVLQEGLNAVLSREQDFTIVGVSGVGKDGLRLVKLLSPDVIMIGTELTDIPVLKLIRQLRDGESDADLVSRIAVFGKFRQADVIVDLFRAGVCAFLEEDIMSEMLVAQLRQFTQGQPVLGHSTIWAIQCWCAQRDAADREGYAAALAKLSAQERRVLDLMAQGLSTAAIASALQLSETTVRSHVHRMKLKLNLTTRDKLIAFAVRCAERRDSLGV